MRDVPVHKCLACGSPLNSVTSVFTPDDPLPKAGDISICFVCGHVAVFMAADLGLRELSPEERKDVADDQRLQKLLTEWREFRARIQARDR